jgi:nicotinamide riboside transporter PnuC
MQTAISLITSAVTIFAMWAAGSKKSWAWLLGIANQIPWLIFIYVFKAWGLLPLTVALTITYTRNHILWRRERKEANA